MFTSGHMANIGRHGVWYRQDGAVELSRGLIFDLRREADE